MFNRFKPEFVLRLSLAIMYLYSGYSLFTNPKSWTQFVPRGFKEWLGQINFITEPVVRFIQAQGAVELLIAVIFLLPFAPRRLVKWLAFLASAEMALILIFSQIDLVTFRDIGLLGAFLALFLLSARK